MIEANPVESRTIKPAKLKRENTRKVVAIDPNGTVLTEPSGFASFDEYMRNLLYLDPHIVVTYSPETWLSKLHDYWREHETWSWRVAVTNKHGRALQNKRVAYYGFRDPKKKRNRYNVVIDAQSFFRKQDADAYDLLTLGMSVRAFCNAHNIEIRASAAGIAAQLLKHPMFYPFARRRVPGFINEAARPYLPGGHYDAYMDTGQRLEAVYYIDQEAAHHYAAQTTPLPNANSVRAVGYTKGKDDRPYARHGGRLYAKELRKHGLIKAKVKVPWLHPDTQKFAPPVMRTEGERVAYIWTNELEYMESLGLRVDYIIGVWGTEEVDKGLAKYAQWARQVQAQHPEMKALLLMPYGLLARRRDVVTYHHPGNGHDSLILGKELLTDTQARTVPTHPDTANALQLGLIQAFVRALSLDMARQVTDGGHEVVSIYADGIFIKLTKGKSLPLFAPWREKGEAQIQLAESLKVPARLKLKRDYQHVHVKEVV